MLAFLPLPFLQQTPITITVKLGQKAGWQRDGWGSYDITLKNETDEGGTVQSWTAHWEAKGKQIGDSWGGELDGTLTPHGTYDHDDVQSLTAQEIDEAKPGVPEIEGSFVVKLAGKDLTVPFTVDVPEAKLPESLKLVKGQHVGAELMVSRFKTWKNPRRALKWLDQCYEAMRDLTGETPFKGQTIIYKESPENPYWAYSGQEVTLNTDFVNQTVKNFDDGILAFGWVHEDGHNFDDSIGDWYIWNGPCAEFQANFKLSYAVTHIPDQSFKMKWRNGAPDYGYKGPEILMNGRELVDRFFLLFGDAYLSDSSRKWDSLSSDEIQSLFQRLTVVYGWAPFKAWYRTYRKLQDSGLKPPDSPEDKVNLIVAILSKTTGQDLTPVFKMWRFPVTPEHVEQMNEKYAIARVEP